MFDKNEYVETFIPTKKNKDKGHGCYPKCMLSSFPCSDTPLSDPLITFVSDDNSLMASQTVDEGYTRRVCLQCKSMKDDDLGQRDAYIKLISCELESIKNDKWESEVTLLETQEALGQIEI